MDSPLEQRLLVIENKLNAVYVSVEQTRKYLWWIMVATVAFFVLPLLGLIFVIPYYLSNLNAVLAM